MEPLPFYRHDPNADYPDIRQWDGLTQKQIDWLLGQGVPVSALMHPEGVRRGLAEIDDEGRFHNIPGGRDHLIFTEPEDVIAWSPATGRIGTWSRPLFSLGQSAIDNPGTFSFDCHLTIHRDPLCWLRSKRDGIVVLDWSLAFERLKDCPRIAVAETLLPFYRQNMKPGRLPELFVIPENRSAAA